MIIDSNELKQQLNPQKQPEIKEDEVHISEQTFRFLKRLEGDCRINRHILLKISYLKVIFLGLPFALTFIGLVLLYQFKALRSALLFQKLPQSQKHAASHIIVNSSDGITAICKLRKKQIRRVIIYVFCFQELLYQLHGDGVLPLGIKIKQQISKYSTNDYLNQGLSEQQASSRLQFYGKNQHLVKIPSYFQYIFNLFFLDLFSYIQYFAFAIYLLQNIVGFGFLLIGGNFFISSINYILVRLSYKNIKEIAEKKHYVSVLRDGVWQQKENGELVPGDLYKPIDQIACDSIVLKEDLFVSQVGFTGQSIPIGKFTLTDSQKIYESQHWVFEGSQIISKKQNCILLAVNTGYSTRKGRIIRKILNPKSGDKDLFKNLVFSSILILLASICLYFAFYHYMFEGIEDRGLIILIFFSFVLQALPAAAPVFIKAAYTNMLLRFRLHKIMGLNRDKTVESSRLETICFDKTGTLTENSVQLKDILVYNKNQQKMEKAFLKNLAQNSILHRLFACCHAVRSQNGSFHGDQIDIQMFKAANFHLQTDNLAEGVIFQVQQRQNQNPLIMEILRVHQFESRFQSMSVVARDKKTKQTFVFSKGAPQKMHGLSMVKINHFDVHIRQLSLQGFRSIAVNYKKITNQEALIYDRQQCLQGTSLLAIVIFANALKSDALETIATLSTAKIKTKMVTGDSIFVAIQTALTLQFVPNGSRIIALEGNTLSAVGGLKAVAVRRQDSKIIEEEISIPILNAKALQGEYLAMDYEFIKKQQAFFLQSNPIVFARATPQAKAVILKKQKQKIIYKFNQRSLWSKLFGGRILKVGMVGDGANDLMAIREADIGIGMCSSDAIYSSDFTINSLSQIQIIVRQGRGGELKIMELLAFVQYFSYIQNVVTIIATNDMAIIGVTPTLLKNVLILYIASIILPFTPPAEKLIPYIPSFNLIGLEYILMWWGNAVIVSGGMGVCMLYYQSTSDFIPNPDRSVLNGSNKTGTVAFLTMFIITLFTLIAFSSSKTFKKPLYHNRPLLILLILDFIFITFAFFFSKNLHFLQIEHIGYQQALIIYLICFATGIINNIYINLIRSAELYRQQYKQERGGVRLKELTHSI